jgi:hypothetical protein
LLEGEPPITEDELEAANQEMNGGPAPAMLPQVAQSIPLADAIEALKRDPALFADVRQRSNRPVPGLP